MSFRLKTILGIALIETVLLLVLVLSALYFLTESNEKQFQQRTDSSTRLFATAIKDALISSDLATLESTVDEMMDNEGVVYVRVRSGDVTLAERGGPFGRDQRLNVDSSYLDVDDGVYDTSMAITVAGQVFGAVDLGFSTSYIDDLIGQAKRAAFGVAGIEILLVAIFSYMLGTYLTRQLENLKAAAHEITREGPGIQVDVIGRDEIGQVAQSFNQMSRELEKTYDKLQHSLLAHKLASRVASRNEALKDAMISASLDAIITTNQEGRIVEFNHVAEEIFGWTKKEILGKTVNETIVPEKYRGAHERGMSEAAAADPSHVMGIRRELEAQRKNGEIFPIEITISPIFTEKVSLFTSFIRDLTELRSRQAEQKLAQDRAEMASQAKSRFLATVSHEIRSPLNAIITMNTLLLETKLDREQLEIAQTVKNGGEVLMSLINDILDFTKIESGKLKLLEEWFDLRTMTRRTVKLLASQATPGDVDVHCHVAPGVCNSYLGDKNRIRQVLINLLSNSLKFTESGHVHVNVEAPPGENRVYFKIIDTGIGISRENLADIFSEFRQVEDADNRRFGGSGLGLSIVARLVKLMGGAINVSSKRGRGTQFTVSLPLQGRSEIVETQSIEIPAVASFDFSQRKILLVEDSETNQMVALSLLSSLKLNVDTASNGEQAVARAESKAYDLILMDLAMPVMDGMEAARRIRSGEGPNRDTMIVAVTANAFDEDRERCLAAGMNDFLSKPIDVREFRLRLPQWLKAVPSGVVAGDEPMVDIKTFEQLQKDTGAEVLPKIFIIFEEETRDRLQKMLRLDAEKDYEQLGSEAHTLKSSAGSFGGLKLQAISREIEHEARSGNYELIGRNMESLPDIVNKTLGELKSLCQESGQ